VRILVIAPRFPWPLEKGDKLRLYQQLLHLSRDHEVHLFAVNHQTVPTEWLEQVGSICASVRVEVISTWKLVFNMLSGVASGLPASVAYFTDHGIAERVRGYHVEIAPDLVYGQLVRTGEYVCQLPSPRVLDFMDAFSAISAQQAREASWALRWLYRWESKRLQTYEQRLGREVEGCVFISQRDRDCLDPDKQWTSIIVPNGIDTDYFKPSVNPKGPAWDISFAGNLGYFPNIEAAEYLVQRILPLLCDQIQRPRILLAGARPHRRVKALAGPEVEIKGWMPDIREAYSSARIFVAPIFYGAGLQNKILEAMAMQVPVVTTRHVNEAIGGIPGRHLLVASHPEEFAEAIRKLLGDSELYHHIAGQGLYFVRNNFRWPDAVSILVQQGFNPLIGEE
jgi:sugar transferase (PEP-CTERM/EpsH1 system associated)